MTRTITLSDVARIAGVSLGTASNAFNRPERVRPEVRAMIEAAARTLGYSGPDPRGRLLMGGKAHAIGIVTPGQLTVTHMMRARYGQELLHGIAQACDAVNSNLLIVAGLGERKLFAIRNAMVDGFILGHFEDVALVAARHGKVPAVLLDAEPLPGTSSAGTSSVRIDGRSGTRRAAEHLLALGHRKFAVISILRQEGEPVWHPPSHEPHVLRNGLPLDRERLQGVADALEAAGLSIHDVPVVEAFPWPPFSEAAAAMLLDRAPDVTAVVSMGDFLAMAVIEAARRRGLAVPQDLSVAGFDDITTAATFDPPLTTVRQPIVEKGRRAAELLFEGGPPQHIMLPVELVIRASTGPAPKTQKSAARRRSRSV